MGKIRIWLVFGLVIGLLGVCLLSIGAKGCLWWRDKNHDDGIIVGSSGPPLTEVSAIAGGRLHTIVLKNDGTVWAWGLDVQGQLGNGDTFWISFTSPVQASGLISATAVAGGGDYTIALKNDGTVWAWGENDDGQLGDGTVISRTTPTQVDMSNLVSATAITSGSADHTIALKNDGTVWAWGDNDEGQLGDGTVISRTTPTQVDMSNLVSATAIAGGLWHTIALKSDGTVWAWGENDDGQLGDGTVISRATPTQVDMSNLVSATAIAGGSGDHTVALKYDGTVWAWGNNYWGQLGDETYIDRHTPVSVSGLTDVIAIACGRHHTIALKDDGTVWTWGRNYYGQLGDGTTTNKSTPVQASNLTDVTAIAGGGEHTIALKNDGTVWTWGDNYRGQLGDGTYFDKSTPVQVVSGP